MARIAISEYKAKQILSTQLGIKYHGIQIYKYDDIKSSISQLNKTKKYVVKIDQGIKKRQKMGLIYKDISINEIGLYVNKLFKKGFIQLLIEEFIPHQIIDEKYLSFELTRDGILAHYSNSGGVDIEDNKNNIMSVLIDSNSILNIDKYFRLKNNFTNKLVDLFDTQNFSFLEINPFLVQNGSPIFLDLAIEVDSAANFIKEINWSEDDYVTTSSALFPEEVKIKSLAETSSASLKLKVLNPEGSIFTIFSGGGASIVLADEIGNRGGAQKLANYAEYSGNPNDEETYIFTKNILSLVKKSPAKHKIIYIAGGVANFTDIRSTFKGIIRALEEEGEILQNTGVKVYVRRGGPFQEEGLKIMERSLKRLGILGKVAGPDMILTDIIVK